MTLSIPVSCPKCEQELRVPLSAITLTEGRALSYDPSALERHVEEHGEGR